MQTNTALAELLDFTDEAEVVQAEANLELARAALADLQPDNQEIALARQQVEDAELQISKLEAGRDPLDEERREARIAAAESRIVSADELHYRLHRSRWPIRNCARRSGV